jgi:hypothetical protein
MWTFTHALLRQQPTGWPPAWWNTALGLEPPAPCVIELADAPCPPAHRTRSASGGKCGDDRPARGRSLLDDLVRLRQK